MEVSKTITPEQRREQIKKKAALYGIKMRDMFISQGTARKEAENLAFLMQSAFADGMGTADAERIEEEKAVIFECAGKNVSMTVKELTDYYIDQECAKIAEECNF